MALDTFVGKKYKLEASDNFDAYMKKLGVGLVTRKIGNIVSPVIDLSKEGDDYVLTSMSTFKNYICKFQPGVEAEQETPDGRKVKTVFTVEDNVITEVQKGNDGKISTIKRVFSNDAVKMELQVEDILATRVYKLQS